MFGYGLVLNTENTVVALKIYKTFHGFEFYDQKNQEGKKNEIELTFLRPVCWKDCVRQATQLYQLRLENLRERPAR